MVGVLLFILKLTGIVLLSVLGLLILIILAALFVPVRYDINASLTEDRKLTAGVCLHWFLHLLQAVFVYGESGAEFEFRIAGIRPGRHRKKRKKAGRKGRSFSEKEEDQYAFNTEKSVVQKSAVQTPETEEQKQDRLLMEKVMNEQQEKQKTLSDPDRSPSDGKRHSRKQSSSEKGGFEKFREKTDRLSKIREQWNEDPMREAVSRLKTELISFLLYILPKRGRADLKIGFDDPAVTGQVLAVLAMLYPRFNGNLNVIPFFDRNILAGEICCSGRIRAVRLAGAAVKLWRDKNIRSFIGKIKNGGM